MKIGIIPNITKDKELQITKDLVNWIEKQESKVLLNEIEAKKINRLDLAYKSQYIYENADFIIVLGGDGTLLGVARRVAKSQTPILGVNLGRLGFLTEVELKDIYNVLEKVLQGEYSIEKRMMLEACIIRNNREEKKFFALNDVVISKGSFARIVNLKTYVDDHYLDTYLADGLIISSPTGSTAYSFSAGGPIVNPKNNLLIITPICPHTLNSRPIIISDKEKFSVEIQEDYNEIILTIDGQEGHILKSGDIVFVKKGDFFTNIIKANNRTFYDVLRNKLADRIVLNKDIL